MVTLDFQPTGMIEKMASGMRFVKRAVEADLARFKAYAEMDEAKGLEYGHDVPADDDGAEKEKPSRPNGNRSQQSRNRQEKQESRA